METNKEKQIKETMDAMQKWEVTLKVWDNFDDMEVLGVVWEPQVIIWIDPAKEWGNETVEHTVKIIKYSCTIFRKKRNQVIASRDFTVDEYFTQWEVEVRLKAHYIYLDVIGKLEENTKSIIWDIAQGKTRKTPDDLKFIFDLFDERFRLLITK